MSNEWRTERLQDLATIVGRGITPKYSTDGDFLVINQKCVRDGRLSLDRARRHDSSMRTIRADKVVVAGDILVNSTGVGTLGRTAPVLASSGTLTADSHVTIVRPNSHVDARWLAYAVSLAEPQIEAMAEGSTGQTELSRHRLAELKLCVPPALHQQNIARTLGALDDKIESNRKLRKYLRTLGIARFRHALEQGSQTVALEDVTLSIARGVTPKYADGDQSAPAVINQKCIRDGLVSLKPARRMQYREVASSKRATGGDILVNSTGAGTLGRVARWHDGDIFVDSHVSVVRPDSKKVNPTILAYALFERQEDIEALATGSTGQTELSPTMLGTLYISTPSGDSTKLAEELHVFEAQSVHLSSEILKLEALRDALLPELLSGRLRIQEKS